MGEPLLTIPEVAKYLHRSERSVWSDVYTGKLPIIRVGPRSVRVDPSDLSVFIEQRRSGQLVRQGVPA